MKKINFNIHLFGSEDYIRGIPWAAQNAHHLLMYSMACCFQRQEVMWLTAFFFPSELYLYLKLSSFPLPSFLRGNFGWTIYNYTYTKGARHDQRPGEKEPARPDMVVHGIQLFWLGVVMPALSTFPFLWHFLWHPLVDSVQGGKNTFKKNNISLAPLRHRYGVSVAWRVNGWQNHFTGRVSQIWQRSIWNLAIVGELPWCQEILILFDDLDNFISLLFCFGE